MAINVGTADRVIRVVLGLVLATLPFMTEFAVWANPAAKFGLPVVGAILVLTAAARFCPLYRLIGLRTCRP
ncbi:MAG: DUF2892 domain-containing protein [Pseudomonadota bacterium]